MKRERPPRGLFEGKNFMTPNIRCYFKLWQHLGYAELSSGTGMNNQPIFGVTVRPAKDLSKLFQSRLEAERYIESLS